MIDTIIAVAERMYKLLVACNYVSQADWLDKRIAILKSGVSSQADRRAVLSELQGIIAGMGSFTDIPLKPSAESGLTAVAAERRQWELAEKLDAAINAVVETNTG